MFRFVIAAIIIFMIFYLAKLLLINSPANRALPRNKPIPDEYRINQSDVAQRLKKDVQMIAGAIGTRSIFNSQKLKETKDYVKSRLEGIGTVKEYPYSYNDTEVVNLELDIVADSTNKSFLVIGAHYDTVLSTPGADDNASAVAVLLEMAEQALRLKKKNMLKENLRFLAFTLEEPPAFNTVDMGSKRYLKAIKDQKKNIKGMICLEMVGYKSKQPNSQEIPFPLNLRNYSRTGDFIAFVANMKSLPLLNRVIGTTEYQNTLPYEKLVVPGNGKGFPVSRLSDHIAFWDNGIQAVMVTDTAFLRNPNYHEEGDRPETLDYEFMAQLVQTLILLF